MVKTKEYGSVVPSAGVGSVANEAALVVDSRVEREGLGAVRSVVRLEVFVRHRLVVVRQYRPLFTWVLLQN